MLDDFLILIGRFHPLIIHLPIGFIVLGILIELNSKKLKWSNKLSFKQTIRMTTVWYKNFYSKKINMLNLSSSQIFDYEKKL